MATFLGVELKPTARREMLTGREAAREVYRAARRQGRTKGSARDAVDGYLSACRDYYERDVLDHEVVSRIALLSAIHGA